MSQKLCGRRLRFDTNRIMVCERVNTGMTILVLLLSPFFTSIFHDSYQQPYTMTCSITHYSLSLSLSIMFQNSEILHQLLSHPLKLSQTLKMMHNQSFRLLHSQKPLTYSYWRSSLIFSSYMHHETPPPSSILLSLSSSSSVMTKCL